MIPFLHAVTNKAFTSMSVDTLTAISKTGVESRFIREDDISAWYVAQIPQICGPLLSGKSMTLREDMTLVMVAYPQCCLTFLNCLWGDLTLQCPNRSPCSGKSCLELIKKVLQLDLTILSSESYRCLTRSGSVCNCSSDVETFSETSNSRWLYMKVTGDGCLWVALM